MRLTVATQAVFTPLLHTLEQQCQASFALLHTLPNPEREELVDVVVQTDGLSVATMNALQAHACAAEVIGYVPAHS